MTKRPKRLLDQACTELCRSARYAIRLQHYLACFLWRHDANLHLREDVKRKT